MPTSIPIPAARFAELFEMLTDHKAYPWQERLFSLMVAGRVPANISLPTGTGKTSIMAIWLLALASQAERHPFGISIPRRLVWVVNRRVVVDQATSEAEQLAVRLRNTENVVELRQVREALGKLSATASKESPLAVSTLRGQFADNAEWRNDPSRPAIVIGTVDMVGSRLLFAGYGRGFKSRPLHAGFLGQEVLLVHDEAHLEPAFQRLIGAIKSEQDRCREFRRLIVMALTATSRGDSEKEFSLSEADWKDKDLQKRLRAKKGIAFHPVDDEKQIADAVYQRALEFKDNGQAILVFLRKLEDVEKVVGKLQKSDLPVQRLTGTLRGLERDALAREDAIFARFMPGPTVAPQPGTVYLVCTSAGEVGINISADHLVCDLTPFDSMAQRFGRVNRFGGGDARIEIVYSTAAADPESKKKNTKSKFDQACKQTLLLLRSEKLSKRADERRDASPAALRDFLKGLPLTERENAFTPQPVILATSDILFDAWALTSIREKLPGRPPVADWLHGVLEWEPPETYVAWREEVEIVTPELQLTYNPEDLLEDYPVKPHELLRDRTDRVVKHIETIAARHPDLPAWLVGSDGKTRVVRLAEFVKRSNEKERMVNLADSTVLLPPTAGGLEKGILDGGVEFDDAYRNLYDVADKWMDVQNTVRRCRVWDDERPQGMRLVRTIDTRPDGNEDLDEEERVSGRRYWQWYIRPKSADDDGSQTAREAQELEPHLKAAERFAAALTEKLVNESDEARAVTLAAKWHDRGKRRSIWQRSIGNTDPSLVLAKSDGKARPIEITAYRHEFGSLIDVSTDPGFRELTPELQDLVLHLIAAHHGRARPHFPAREVFDSEHSDESAAGMAREVPRRFARLQRKYGRWGLAYLESLLRAADALASQNNDLESKPPNSSASALSTQEAS